MVQKLHMQKVFTGIQLRNLVFCWIHSFRIIQHDLNNTDVLQYPQPDFNYWVKGKQGILLNFWPDLLLSLRIQSFLNLGHIFFSNCFALPPPYYPLVKQLFFIECWTTTVLQVTSILGAILIDMSSWNSNLQAYGILTCEIWNRIQKQFI